MSESKEFLGKTLDAAIAEACTYYDVPREKLEIEIIEDAKTGIFGIVGARKARIRARLATLPDFMQNPAALQEKPEKPEGRRRRNDRRKEKAENAEAPKEENRENRRESRQEAEKEAAPAASSLPVPRPSAVPALSPEPSAARESSEEKDARPEEGADAPRARQPRQPRQNKGNNRKEAAPKSEDADALHIGAGDAGGALRGDAAGALPMEDEADEAGSAGGGAVDAGGVGLAAGFDEGGATGAGRAVSDAVRDGG